MTDEKVDHPKHYNAGKIEVIDAIEDWKLGFHEGNVVKYIARAKHKGTELEDLRKAAWYLNRAIENFQAQKQRAQTLHFAEDNSKPTLCGSYGHDHVTNDWARVDCKECKKIYDIEAEAKKAFKSIRELAEQFHDTYYRDQLLEPLGSAE